MSQLGMNHEDDLNPSTRCLSFGPSGLAAQQARNTERAAQNQAELAEQAEKKQARQARQAEWTTPSRSAPWRGSPMKT